MKNILIACLILSSCTTNAQWKGKQAAVALTYDDALNVHLDKVIPQLDSFNFKATFYLIGASPAFTKRIPDWRKAAARGHELGNHTLFHPCRGDLPNRQWVQPDRDLAKYTVQRASDEIMMNNALLEATDGKKKRTMACPCGESAIGDSSFLFKAKPYFVATRDGTPDANQVNAFNTTKIEWISALPETEDQLIAAMQKAINDRALLIIVFHGVGGEHPLNISLDKHRELMRFIKQNESKIWVAPFLEIAESMK